MITEKLPVLKMRLQYVSQGSRKIPMDIILFACAQGNSYGLISSSVHSLYDRHHYSDKSSL